MIERKQKLKFLASPGIRSASHIFRGIGSFFLRLFPNVDSLLKQSGLTDEYKINSRDYIAIAFFMGIFMFILVTIPIYYVILVGGGEHPVIGPIFGGIVGFGMFAYLLMYPKSLVNKRVKYLERNLLFALRTVLVQIRSGVPVFNSLASLSTGDYGPITGEFKTVIEKVNAGEPVVNALEELANRNPSLYFRRAIWQLVNSLKSGSDVGDNIANVISSLSKEQLIEIRRYKSILNPLAMMYMMVAVILPSLGITMLIILSTFPGMEAIGREQTYYMLFGGTAIMQFIFMGIIKSKRPNLIGN
ncbi:MAG: type II secretion system F family protein [Candidatus Altiarchaeota archaeon]